MNIMAFVLRHALFIYWSGVVFGGHFWALGGMEMLRAGAGVRHFSFEISAVFGLWGKREFFFVLLGFVGSGESFFLFVVNEIDDDKFFYSFRAFLKH